VTFGVHAFGFCAHFVPSSSLFPSLPPSLPPDLRSLSQDLGEEPNGRRMPHGIAHCVHEEDGQVEAAGREGGREGRDG